MSKGNGLTWSEEDLRKAELRISGNSITDIPVKKENKYKAQKKEYNGEIFDSTFEAKIAQELDWRVKGGDIQSYETQVEIRIIVNGVFICKHLMDFVITHNDGSIEYVEAKGYETAVWKLKKKLFLALYPGVKYTIRKNPKTKKKS